MGNDQHLNARRLARRVVKSFGGLLDIAPAERPLVNRSRSDAEALARDWQRIGGDMRRAFEKIRREEATREN